MGFVQIASQILTNGNWVTNFYFSFTIMGKMASNAGPHSSQILTWAKSTNSTSQIWTHTGTHYRAA